MKYKIYIKIDDTNLTYTVDEYIRKDGFIEFFDKITNKKILFNEAYVIQIQEVQ